MDERPSLRALLVHVDCLDEQAIYHLHRVDIWTLSEIEFARGASRVPHPAGYEPLVIVELGADLRRLPHGATTTVTTA